VIGIIIMIMIINIIIMIIIIMYSKLQSKYIFAALALFYYDYRCLMILIKTKFIPNQNF